MSIIYQLWWMQGNAKTPLPWGPTIHPSPIKLNSTEADLVSVMSSCETAASVKPWINLYMWFELKADHTRGTFVITFIHAFPVRFNEKVKM